MRDAPAYDLEAAVVGCLLGAAVGDALGLPREGLAPQKARRLFGEEMRHRFVCGHGMVSDDTDHAAMTALALLEGPASPEDFARKLARRLRWWFAALPGGVGLATARACLRLWCGVSPERSGVFSAGNGPMMRAPVIGVACATDLERMRAYVRASTRLTHTDPKAERAAFAVALAASYRLRHGDAEPPAPAVLAEMAELLPDADDELQAVLHRAADPAPLDGRWPKGPGGYAYDTLLAVLHTWLNHPGRLPQALTTAILLGGDPDTIGAILGGIAGANLGSERIPAAWVAGICEWPRSMAWLRRLGLALAASTAGDATARPPRYFAPGVLPRNAAFLALVLAHGMYRLVRTGSCR